MRVVLGFGGLPTRQANYHAWPTDWLKTATFEAVKLGLKSTGLQEESLCMEKMIHLRDHLFCLNSVRASGDNLVRGNT
jgi:hypothetical protein